MKKIESVLEGLAVVLGTLETNLAALFVLITWILAKMPYYW